ncbi:MAG: lipocalin family protein [Prevotellaceae bacterium]|nr:lipocalin family protein [Prevotellaceae bacterium]
MTAFEQIVFSVKIGCKFKKETEMKKYLKFSWAILLALCIGISSCSKDDDDSNSSDLAGKWQLTEVRADGVLQNPNVSTDYNEPCDYEGWSQFKSDGTFIDYDGCDNSTSGGTWRLNGNTVTVVADVFSISLNFKIISLNQTTLVFETTAIGFDDNYHVIDVILLLTYKRI